MKSALCVFAIGTAASVSAAQVHFEPDLSRGAGTFRAQGGGVRFWSTESGARFALRNVDGVHAALDFDVGGAPPRGERERCLPRTHFQGRNSASAERVFERLVHAGVAPGVDLVWRDGDGALEYDLEVAPGARVDTIEVRVRGHEHLWVAPDGSLVIETAAGALLQPPPRTFEVSSAAPPRAIASRFVLRGADAFGFEVPQRDASRALVIDPALRWSSYLSGSSEQWITAAAIGPGDTTIVAGTTISPDFPTTLGAFDPLWSGGHDAFVSAFSADGRQLLWSTLLGGAEDESVRSIAVDGSGAVIVAGETKSADFPITLGAFDTSFNGDRDVFLARLDPSGSILEWSTVLGGTLADRCGGLARSSAGHWVLMGSSRGAGFPTSAGAYDPSFNGGGFFGDAFACELSADGASLRWSTMLGSVGDDLGEQLALAPNGDVVLSGTTYSSAFPTTPGAFDNTWQAISDAFVARLSPDGAQLIFSTLLGGSGEEFVRALEVEASGAVLCAGEWTTPDFPATPGVFDEMFEGPSDGFVARLAPNGTQLLTATLLGGAETDRVVDIEIDPNGNVIVGAETLSVDLVTTAGCYDPSANMPIGALEQDLYIARFPPGLSWPDYATYFGSTNADSLSKMLLAPAGDVALAGTTQGPGFPVSPGAYQPMWNVTSLHDGFASRLTFAVHPIAYGVAKLNSLGSYGMIRYEGFPGVGDPAFKVGIDFAVPNAWCQVFSGAQAAFTPFLGTHLLVSAPYRRYPRFKSDFLGYGSRAIPLSPAWIGSTLHFQVWYEDPGDPQGANLSEGLRVIVYP